jgi:hypothetical protein
MKVLVRSVLYELRMLAMVMMSLSPADKVLLFTPVKVMVRLEPTLHPNDEFMLEGLFGADTVVMLVHAPFAIDNSTGKVITIRLLIPRVFDIVIPNV